mmetsp:Transcript_14445/g.27526  ORF Transcript_14445/g.27526 Transcript_14445/m.27526 type:complete len:331 (+) Transcript_14445:54-1046(+)
MTAIANSESTSDLAQSHSRPPQLLTPLDDVHQFWSKRWEGPKLGWHLHDVNPHLLKYTDILIGRNGSQIDAAKDGIRIFVPLCGKSVDLASLASHSEVSHVVGIDIVRNAAEEFANEHPQFSLEEVKFCDENLVDSFGSDSKEKMTKSEDGENCGFESHDGRNSNNKSISQMSTFYGNRISIVNGDLFQFLAMERQERTKYISKYDADEQKHHLFDAIYDRASIVAIDPSLHLEYVTSMGKIIRPGGIMLLITIEKRRTLNEEAKTDGPPFSIDESQVRALYESQPWVEYVTLLEEVDDLITEEAKERWQKKGVLELYDLVFVIKAKDVF